MGYQNRDIIKKSFYPYSSSTPNTISLLVPNSTNSVVVQEEVAYEKVVQKALPSVVTIGIHKTLSDTTIPFGPFGQIVTPDGNQNLEQNIGSGFILSPNGILVTNKHVVADTQATYTVLTSDQKKYDVTNIYRDPLNDIAILKINTTNLPVLTLGDSTALRLGQIVIAIGTPLGEFQNTVTHGIISGLGRGITAGSPYEGYVERLDDVIQIDAPISPGNSGGPLLNIQGNVIGITTAISEQGQNLGFAIPVNLIREIVNNFNQNGFSYKQPYVGIRYRMVDKNTAINNQTVEGAYVISVISGSPADKVGIQAGDIIVRIDNQNIQTTDDRSLSKIILQKKVGERVIVIIWRNGKNQEKSLVLEEFRS